MVRVFCCQCAGGGSALDVEFSPMGRDLKSLPIEFELVPCTGKIDVQRLLKAFEGGADGVFIIGCPPGECRMAEGNLRASKRAAVARQILDEIGVESDRIEVIMPGANAESLEAAIENIRDRVNGMEPSIINLAA